MKAIYWLVPLAATISFGALAQGNNDAAYCKALSDKYETFLANLAGRSPQADSVDGKVAVEQCKKGNTAAGIPVLEQKLKNAKIDLPPRS